MSLILFVQCHPNLSMFRNSHECGFLVIKFRIGLVEYLLRVPAKSLEIALHPSPSSHATLGNPITILIAQVLQADEEGQGPETDRFLMSVHKSGVPLSLLRRASTDEIFTHRRTRAVRTILIARERQCAHSHLLLERPVRDTVIVALRLLNGVIMHLTFAGNIFPLTKDATKMNTGVSNLDLQNPHSNQKWIPWAERHIGTTALTSM